MSEYAALSLKEELSVNVLGLQQKIGLVWADGMIGAIPVFKDKESAEAYVGNGRADVVELTVLEKAGKL
jgi:hypothetical protein